MLSVSAWCNITHICSLIGHVHSSENDYCGLVATKTKEYYWFMWSLNCVWNFKSFSQCRYTYAAFCIERIKDAMSSKRGHRSSIRKKSTGNKIRIRLSGLSMSAVVNSMSSFHMKYKWWQAATKTGSSLRKMFTAECL